MQRFSVSQASKVTLWLLLVFSVVITPATALANGSSATTMEMPNGAELPPKPKIYID